MLGLTGITKFGEIGTLLFVYVFISTTRDWTQHAPTSKPCPQLIPSIFICEGWISLRGKHFKKSCLSAGVCVQDGPKWDGCVSGAETQLSDNAHRHGLAGQPLEHHLPACLQSERCQSSEELESEPSWRSLWRAVQTMACQPWQRRVASSPLCSWVPVTFVLLGGGSLDLGIP